MFKVILVALLMAVAASVVAGEDREIPWNNLEQVIRGGLFKAAKAAYDDFSNALAQRAARLSGEESDKDEETVSLEDQQL